MALITSIKEVRDFIAINVTSDFDDIKPYIEQAEIKFIKPVLGKALYDKLTNDVQASGGISGDYEALLKKVQLPLIYYAYYIAVPILNVQVSSSGIHIATTETKKTAFEWQVDQLRDSWLNTAHDFIEELLEFLEENASKYSEWGGSDARNEALSLFITSASMFNECYFINSSRRLYSALRPIIKSIEQKYIKGTIGEDMFDAIKLQIQASDGPDSDTQALLDIINPCVAHLTMARALSELSLEIIPNAIYENVVQVVSKAKQSGGVDKISILKSELVADGRAELKQLQDYLDANASATKYKEYFDSDLYTEPETGVVRGEFVNDATKGFFLA
jgi:hypothetical protein